MKFKEIMARAMRPKDGRTGLTVRAAATEGEAEVLVYDQIGYWGITAEDFRRELNQIDAKVIHLRIDSPGGDVFAARAMKTALEQHPAQIIAHVDGLAASAASYLMLAGDRVEAAKGAFVMIHNAWSITLGDHREHEASAEMLAKIDGTIRADYGAKSGKGADHFIDLMDAETWLEADEAKALGLVDTVYEKDGGAENRFNLDIFDNPPAALTQREQEETAAAQRRAAQMRKLEFFERAAP